MCGVEILYLIKCRDVENWAAISFITNVLVVNTKALC